MMIPSDPRFQAWKAAALEADRERGVVVPLRELPGFIRGVARLVHFWALAEGRRRPILERVLSFPLWERTKG